MQSIIKLLLWTFVVGFVLFALHYAYKELKLRNQVIDVLMLETISQEPDIMVIDEAVDAMAAQITTQQFTTGQDKMRQQQLRSMNQKIEQQVKGEASNIGLVDSAPTPMPQAPTLIPAPAVQEKPAQTQPSSAIMTAPSQVKVRIEAAQKRLTEQAQAMAAQVQQQMAAQATAANVQAPTPIPAPAVQEKPAQTQPSSAIMTAPAQVKARIEAAQKRLTEQAQAMATQVQQHILPRATAATSARANSNIEATDAKVERTNCNTCTKSKTVDSNRSSLIGRLNELNTMLINLYERAISAYLDAGLSESDGRIQYAKREQNAARRELQMQTR